MRVVFLKDVPNVAESGDVKDVADGYARNYLLPKKLAAPATPALIKQIEAQRQAEARRVGHQETQLRDLARELDGVSVSIKAKVGARERLYGSVTAADIAMAIQQVTGHVVDRRRIELMEPIHTLGVYTVTLRLARDLTPTIQVLVEAQEA